MVIQEIVELCDVQMHEVATYANVRLGSYKMDGPCPLDEFKMYKVKLEAMDVDRLFLLDCGFATYTSDLTCRLKDASPGLLADKRVRMVIDEAYFPVSAKQAILIVSPNEKCGPLTIYDGNHRAIAQFLMRHTVQDVLAFVCVHCRISEWEYVPLLGRIQCKL